MTDSEKDVTQLLLDWRSGDPEALDKLTPKVIEELRRIARGFLRKERQDHTLQPTALVNEVYVRLIDARQVDWQNRAHFIGIAARQMRQILVDHARGHNAKKRWGDAPKTFVELDLIPQSSEIDVIDLDRALTDLATFNPERSRVVELRFFGGSTNEEVAEILGIGLTTVKRRWNVARLWLRRELSGKTAPSQERWLEVTPELWPQVERIVDKALALPEDELLKGLRMHGLIKKIGKTYKYYLTKLGRRVIATALKLRRLYLGRRGGVRPGQERI